MLHALKRWKLWCFLGDVPETVGELVSNWFDLYFSFLSGPGLQVAHFKAEKKDSCIETGCLSKLLFALEDLIEASTCKKNPVFVYMCCGNISFRPRLPTKPPEFEH